MLTILPLILDYLDNPFELVKCDQSILINIKKCCLSIKTDRQINKQILKIYKWKYIYHL